MVLFVVGYNMSLYGLWWKRNGRQWSWINLESRDQKGRKFLAVSEASKAVFRPTPAIKVGFFDRSGFAAEGTSFFFFASAVPFRGFFPHRLRPLYLSGNVTKRKCFGRLPLTSGSDHYTWNSGSSRTYTHFLAEWFVYHYWCNQRREGFLTEASRCFLVYSLFLKWPFTP